MDGLYKVSDTTGDHSYVIFWLSLILISLTSTVLHGRALYPYYPVIIICTIQQTRWLQSSLHASLSWQCTIGLNDKQCVCEGWTLYWVNHDPIYSILVMIRWSSEQGTRRSLVCRKFHNNKTGKK